MTGFDSHDIGRVEHLDAVHASAYSHKVRRILKHRHDIWLTDLPIGSPAFQTFLEVCLHCFPINTAERAAERYANACRSLGRYPETFKEFGEAERGAGL